MYSKQNVDENTDYKPGHAISLEDRMISVKYDSTLCLNNEGCLSVVNSGSSGGGGIDYKGGKGIQIINDQINANVDGSTIKVNDKNQLEVINGGGTGKEYKAGNALTLNTDSFDVNVDSSTIKINEQNQLTVPQPTIPTYTAGSALALNTDNKFDVNVDNSTIKVNEQNQLTVPQPIIPSYTAGKGLTLNPDNKFDVSIDNSTIKINDQNQLTVINECKTYSAGDGIEIEEQSSGKMPNVNAIIKARVDGTTIKCEDGVLNVPQPTIPTYTAGSALSLNQDNKFNVNVDGSTLKVNASNQLEVINSGDSSYTAGEGISISNNKIMINKDWFDIRDSAANPDGTLQLQNVSTDSSKQDIRLCVVEARPKNAIRNSGFFTQSLGMNPDYEIDFNKSINQEVIHVKDQNNDEASPDQGLVNQSSSSRSNDDEEEIDNYLLTITDIPEELNLSSDADFLRIHLPNRITDKNGKPIDSVICRVNIDDLYTCDIESSGFDQLTNSSFINVNEDIPKDLVSFNSVGCDFDIKHIAEVIDPNFLYCEGYEIRINDKDNKVLAAFISDGKGKFAIHGTDLPVECIDLPNSIVHFNYEQHKELFKDEVKVVFHMMSEDFDYRTYTFKNFKNCGGNPSYTIPYIKEINDPGPDPSPEPGHYKSSDYPTIFIKNSEGWDVNFNDMMDQFGNEIPAEMYPLAFIVVHHKNDTSKLLIEYHVDAKEVFNYDREIFDDSCFDGPVFHYNYERHHEALGDEILFVFGYNHVIKPIVSYNVFITFDQSNSIVTPIRSDKIKASSKYYTVEYLSNHEQPGLMSSRSVNLQELLLRGELMIDIIYDKTNIKTENVIKCKELIADNGFQLYRSPLIFIYEPEDFGVELIHGIKYWYIDFGYSHDSDEFKALANNQPFEFVDSKFFGLNYCLKKELIEYQGLTEREQSSLRTSSESKWTGGNIYYHLKEDTKIIDKYVEDPLTISLIISNSDQLSFV
ncbi:hypothetical protein M9Y10_025766 [Tritrichomonas musculus]|uniref:Uncharacterized protein n=1 Tax=Tritrichomonas musculus TaxID=1915356 RepID=A0ABR2HBZ4_9EUKA